MKKVVIKIDGMRCVMCETHINDVVRRVYGVKKVTSSHTKGQTVVLIEDLTSLEKITEAITAQGYLILKYKVVDEEKKGFFQFLRNRKKEQNGNISN